MKIGIHHRPGSFSDKWIKYCQDHNIEYKIVSAYDNDIIDQLEDCDAFFWHHHHSKYSDNIIAKQLLTTLQLAGKIVYPDIYTGYSFDDKITQKYIFEINNIPAVPTFVFYSKDKAFQWAEKTTYPKVFKLRGGAGSSNVRLVKNFSEAKKIISKSFGSGFHLFSRKSYIKDKLSRWISGDESFVSVLKGFYRLIKLPQDISLLPKQKGYVYFQEFIPNNNYDTRVVVIAGKYAFAEKRYVRDGDFRASGSGKFEYSDIDLEILRISFEVAEKLNLQSIAFDFIYDENNNPLIVEMSYGFGTHGITHAPHFWTKDLKCHENLNNIEGLIFEYVINRDVE